MPGTGLLEDYLTGLAADGAPDAAADYLFTYDDSAGALKKVLLEDLPSAGGFDADFAQSVYNTAVITLGTSTDGAFADADPTNAKLTFTPASAGKYRVTFTFSHYIAAAGCNVYFRLTDGSTQSPAQVRYSGGAVNQTQVITISFVFTWTATAQAVKLQKRITVATTITSHDIEADSGNGLGLAMSVERIGA
jgi:hypothetical protein